MKPMVGKLAVSPVLQPENLTTAVAKDRHRKIGIAIGVEVSRLDVSHPADIL
jgi:hypothetical protein